MEGYNKSGDQGVKFTRRGGRRHPLLSAEEEAPLLEVIELKGVKGLMKTANDISALVEAKAGKKVPDDYLWDLLNRNGWKKKMPRPHHPKRDPLSHHDLKKTPGLAGFLTVACN